VFYGKYKETPISPYSEDDEWSTSMDKINNLVNEAGVLINAGELHEAHLKLEEVRGLWQEIFERNKVSMVGFYLTEFHDVMEKAVDGSNDPNFEKLSKVCDELNEKWAKVESLKLDLSADKMQDYEEKKKAEKQNIDAFCEKVLANDDAELVSLAGKLKKGFISIYLAYG
jgi:hypothetical protein